MEWLLKKKKKKKKLQLLDFVYWFLIISKSGITELQHNSHN